MFQRILAFLCALLLAFSLAAGAEPSILDFKTAQSGAGDWVTTGLPDLMGRGGEWYAIALAQAGGYDLSACRTALEDYVASLTTINTPHRGCIFADFLLDKIPAEVKDEIADKYNTTLKKLGDPNPDFLAAVNDLTASHCTEFDAGTPVPAGVYCQSIGSTVKKAAGGKFPLNFSYHLVKHFDGSNDGLVSEQSFAWGENYRLLTPTGDRGISHGDMIDLNRENIEGFDVREFYVQLVNDLKNRGL